LHIDLSSDDLGGGGLYLCEVGFVTAVKLFPGAAAKQNER
jgi:hypothetical protein